MLSTQAIWRANRKRLDGTPHGNTPNSDAQPQAKDVLILFEIETDPHERFNFYKLDHVDQGEVLNGQSADEVDPETIFERIKSK